MLAPLGAGMALEELERYPEALAAYDRALELQPGSFEALYGRANALLMGGRVEASVAAFDRVLAIRPRHQGAGGNRIAALIRLGRLEEALASLEELVPVYPADAGLHANRGAMLQLLGRHSEAVDSLQRALALQPAMGAAWLNLGVAQMALNQYEDALQSLDRLIAIQPRNAEAHNYRAMVRLVQGQYEDAWPDFEWREAGTRGRSGSPLAARWLGRVDDRRDLRGVSIQVHHEQGHGDTIHFLRYVKLLQARGARVQLRVQPALASLVQRCIGAEPWDEEAAQGADFQSPLLSLPYAFGTTPASIPASLPYLWADEQRVHRWREHLRSGGQLGAWPGGPSEGPPTVGLAWSGSAHNVADRRRSLSPARLAPLLQDGLRFLALQPDLRPGDREQLDALRAIELFGPLIEDFEDTAALIAQCDLVISVDTAVAHLAGAMGKPVWILLPYSPDWRWMLEREDSPWYPGSRLFRQREPGDWDSALAAAAAALAGFVSASSGSSN
jgi:Flp pilus assembly protein TadD